MAGLHLPIIGELRLFDQQQTYLRLDQTDPPDVRLVLQNPILLASLTVEENFDFRLANRCSCCGMRFVIVCMLSWRLWGAL